MHSARQQVEQRAAARDVVLSNLSARQRADLIGQRAHGGPLPDTVSFAQRADELVRRFGMAMAAQLLAAETPPAPVCQQDPQAFIKALESSGWLPGAEITGSPGDGGYLKGGSKHYLFRMRELQPDAPRMPAMGKGWLRGEMPQVAVTFDWLRTWVPANVIRNIFANLFAGQGYAIDTSTGLAIGNVPRTDWIVTMRYDNGLQKVERR